MIGYHCPKNLGVFISSQSLSYLEAYDLKTITYTSTYLLFKYFKSSPSNLTNIAIHSQNIDIVHQIRRLLKQTLHSYTGYQHFFQNPQIRQETKKAIRQLEGKIADHFYHISESW